MSELESSCRLRLIPYVEVGPTVTLASSKACSCQAQLKDRGMAGGQMAGAKVGVGIWADDGFRAPGWTC